ncbi:TonB-dependent receptor [Thalassotalea psychrophila]|uniref:TonB-dependent receptor n=1 Tax=Thalassotalea psychrophila TaxID=3065647 RepID=A0ABY9TPY4_9GAMM|nr:TonB-dependent receptor [Colwelliaceae bacterium SQ149]
MNKSLITLAIQSAIIGGAALVTPQVLAEEEQSVNRVIQENKVSENKDALAQDEEVEKITVTGSRLRRDSFSVATPLVTVSKEDIQDTGLGSLSEVLVDEVPAITESSSNMNTQSSVSATGLSTVNLRNLGTDRTLTLIDGRRVVSNSYSGNYVSLGTIPTGMVEKVEVITGGASAAYGSDAIAGVVNIITQQHKEGFEFQARGGETPEGGGKEFTLDANFGSDFADGRGYMFISSTWDRQFGIDVDDRDRSAIESSYDYNTSELCNEMNTVDGDQCMRDITQAEWRERSDGTQGGVFEEGNDFSDGGFYYTADGLQTGWVEERDGINPYQWDKIKTPNDRLATALKVNYDITDDIMGSFQVQYSNNESVNVKSPEDEYESAYVPIIDPETGELDRVRPGKISIDNPFAPAIIADNAGSSISWDRRFYEVGNVTTDNERETVRTWAGLQGTMFDGDWDWDVSVGYGKFEQNQKRLNELNTVRVSQALDSEYADDGVTIQCADEDARAAGCVPLNIFGEGSITTEMADWIRATPKINTEIEQVNILGFIAGDLFEMPAGPVAAVFGAEYRKDKQTVSTDEGHQYGGITFNLVPSFEGDVDVYEAFAEFAFPLLKNKAFAKSLDAETSVRVADYSHEGIDLMSSYKVGLTWQPVEGYMIRGNFARAQRAPNITELLSPPRGDYDTYTDICDGTSATSTEAGHDNCRLEPGIAAELAADPDFVFEDDNNGYGPGAGNENLKEETADTYTVGITMSPGFIDNFDIAIDYYNITVEDAISEIGNEELLAECYNSSVAFGDSNPFCADITRDDEGQIIEMLQRQINVGELKTSGYDLAIQYSLDLNDFGRLKLTGDMTHVIEHTESFEGNDGLVELNNNGQLDTGIFEDSASASLAWYKDGWRVRWSTKYKGPVVDAHDRVDDYKELFSENDANCAAANDDCIANPETPKYLYYGSFIKHNVSISYAFDYSQTQIRLFGGANNVFDNKGPFIPRTGDNYERGVGNFDSKYEGGVGRFVYLGTEVKF